MSARGGARRRVALVTATAGLVLPLVACGGDSEYCATIRQTEAQLKVIGTAATDADLEAAGGAAQRIADVAPPEVEPEWSAIATALSTFRTTLEQTGITYEDLRARRNLQSLDQQDRDRLQAAITGLREANTPEATGRINRQVETECDIVIRQSPSGS